MPQTHALNPLPSGSVSAPRGWRGRWTLSALAAAAVLTLAACGGGGGGSSASGNGGGQTAAAATYSGAVSGLGSIVVNGVRFSTSGANVTEAESEGAYARPFALGTTVSVSGEVDDDRATATATSVTVHGGVRGAVSAVDTSAGTLTVAGQLVQVDANTIFEGLNGAALTLAGLKSAVDAANATLTTTDTVYAEVHAVGDAATGLLATRVEQTSAAEALADGVAVLGKVVAGTLDTTAQRFGFLLRSGVTVTVNYAGAPVRPTGAALADGVAVRVILPASTDFSAIGNGSTVNATKVIVKRDRAIVGRAKLRGAVSAINGTTLTVNDVTVDVSQATFEGGLTLASLVAGNAATGVRGTVIKVTGTFANGVLVARKVEADSREYSVASGGGVKLYGTVSNATAASGASPATFSVQGVTLTLPASGVTLPANGAYVEVVASMVNGVLTVVRIGSEGGIGERSFELYGTAPCAAGSSDLMASFALTLRNGTSTTVDGRAATIDLEDGVRMTAGVPNAQCFVEVKGAASNGVVSATRIEVKARTVPAVN